MAGKKGTYSNIIIYDERKRYFYLYPQRNKPFLDDEIRDMGIGLLDQARRAVQHTYGDVAAPYTDPRYSTPYSTTDAFRVRGTGASKDFTVTGGVSVDHPAVLYAKGFYIFITGDLTYSAQMYGSDNIDLATEIDKAKTLTPIPNITTPLTDRIDIVYADLHFEEVSAASGTDSDVYRDTNLKNPIVGTETANRLRAVFDIRVREDWTDPITKNIFDHSEFLGGIVGDDTDPTDNHYKIPIAVIYRRALQDVINDADIVDLLTLYNKRVFTMEEMNYRLHHGGYTQQDVTEKSYTGGFVAQFQGAIVDEGAFATGLNRGLGTEAFNTNAVTPRVVDKDGKFFFNGLMVGHDTGIITYETGPVMLGDGEIVAKNESVRSLYVGYGATGITGMREYKNAVDIVAPGLTGTIGLKTTIQNGSTGSLAVYYGAVQGGIVQNFYTVDYAGRIGLNTFTPGWTKPDSDWNTDRYNDGLFGATGVNIVQDAVGSQRISDHLFVGKDAYVSRDMFGKTWKIPAYLSQATPALVGFTGLAGVTGSLIPSSVSTVIFRRGIAVVGESGMSGYGYTGAFCGQYEAYNIAGERMFTIGDLGDTFDRVVMTLFGTDATFSLVSDSLMLLPGGYGQVLPGDTCVYDITLQEGVHVAGIYTIQWTGMDGITGLVGDILANPGFTGYLGDERTYTYRFYNDPPDFPPEYRTGTAYGIQVVDDPLGYDLGLTDTHHGDLILKDLANIPGYPDIHLDSATLTITRGANPSVNVGFTGVHCFGSSNYGGDLLDLKFAKLDLGSGADAWLFNGDVYFNGNGAMNKVTFSPNVLFRDDVFMYGTLFADQLVFNFANVNNLVVQNDLIVQEKAYIEGAAVIGSNAVLDFPTLLAANPNLTLYNKGDGQMHNLILETDDTTTPLFGSLTFKTKAYPEINVRIGGVMNDTVDPFGIHIVDARPSVSLDTEDSFKKITLDYSDGSGNYGNIDLVLRGDLTLSRGLVAANIACGDVSTFDPLFSFSCNGPAQINDTLWVKDIKFIGPAAIEGMNDIQTPQNVSVIYEDAEHVENNTDINLKNKDFSVTYRAYLNNRNILGYAGGIGVPATYYAATYTGMGGIWAHDTLTYTQDEFDTLVAAGDPGASANELLVSSITTESYKRNSFDRVIVATLGTLYIEWTGYAYDPYSAIPSDVIQQYYFESPYFRNRDEEAKIDWMTGVGRFGDDNLIVRVTADIIDTDPTSPNIHTVSESIGIYIPKVTWYQYGPVAADPAYRSFVLFYPYENAISKFNLVDMTNKTGFPTLAQYWQLGLYPRLRKLSRRASVTTNLERIYDGEWDLDLVIAPKGIGNCAQMIGKLYIAAMTS